MSDCVNCQCEDIVVGKTGCQSLLAQNDDKIKQHALVLRDSQLCDMPTHSGALTKMCLISFVG